MLKQRRIEIDFITIYSQSHGPCLLRQGGFETRPYLRRNSL
jgi:hypothetical protein